MKVTQVNSSFVKETPYQELCKANIYRLYRCPDGNYGKQHFSMRIKPLKNLTMDEIAESIDNPNYAFVSISYEE